MQTKRQKPTIGRVFMSCSVCCSEKVPNHKHYGAMLPTCFACRQFFRRNTFGSTMQCKNAPNHSHCNLMSIDVKTRVLCQYTRYNRCLDVGMKPWLCMTEEKKKKQKEKRKNKLKKVHHLSVIWLLLGGNKKVRSCPSRALQSSTKLYI